MADRSEPPSAAPATTGEQPTPEGSPRPKMSLDWLDPGAEWGIRASRGPAGYRVGDLMVGSYGELPDIWRDDTMRPRGAAPSEGSPRMAYSVVSKAEMWTENSADLYEEAIQRRWKPATDVDWASIPAGTTELDRARAQMLTIMAEQAWVQSVTYGGWLKRLSYGYYEVKLFLATVVFSLARHTEAFRKRAMLHGGGMGLQGPGALNRELIGARDFNEMILFNQFVADSFMEVQLAWLAAGASTPAEARLYTLARQDRMRALAFGHERLRALLAAEPERMPQIEQYLRRAESAVAVDLTDTVSSEALAIVLGGDVEAMGTGAERLAELRRAQVRAYLQRLRAAGIEREGKQTGRFQVATGQITEEERRARRKGSRAMNPVVGDNRDA
jgi:hypothetical protein